MRGDVGIRKSVKESPYPLRSSHVLAVDNRLEKVIG